VNSIPYLQASGWNAEVAVARFFDTEAIEQLHPTAAEDLDQRDGPEQRGVPPPPGQHQHFAIVYDINFIFSVISRLLGYVLLGIQFGLKHSWLLTCLLVLMLYKTHGVLGTVVLVGRVGMWIYAHVPASVQDSIKVLSAVAIGYWADIGRAARQWLCSMCTGRCEWVAS
jgi:hypothetical protein